MGDGGSLWGARGYEYVRTLPSKSPKAPQFLHSGPLLGCLMGATSLSCPLGSGGGTPLAWEEGIPSGGEEQPPPPPKRRARRTCGREGSC